MEDLNSINKRQHKMTMINRKECTLTGVTDIVAFDENEVILETDMGILMIRGHSLHIKRLTLDKGEVDVDGTMDSFLYSEHKSMAAKSESLFSRLFK